MVGAQWDLANKNKRGNQQHSTGRIKGHSVDTYVTVCALCYCALSEHGRKTEYANTTSVSNMHTPRLLWVRYSK